MELFPHGQQVRLRNRMHGGYLHADDDGARVSLSRSSDSNHTAWQVHRVTRGVDDYFLLYSVAYGRYLATSPLYAGHAAVQVDRRASEQVNLLWEAVRIADNDDDIIILSATNRQL